MSAPSKDTHSKTLYDWLGVFCFLGCLLATVGLSCLGIANILKKDLRLEAVDALLSMLKLLGLNCGLLLASWIGLHTSSEIMLALIAIVQILLLPMSGFYLEFGCSYDNHEPEKPRYYILSMLTSAVTFSIRSIVLITIVARKYLPMSFAKQTVSKGVTLPLLISYVLAVIFIATGALGTFGLLAGQASILGKLAASVIVSGTILLLAVAARLLRVLHASKIVHSRALLGSLQSTKLTAFVISHHLGSTFLYYTRACIPLMATATICISIEGWRSIVIPSNPLITVAITLFPIYDTVCGTRMLILKESIWDERAAPSQQWFFIPACSAMILFLQNTNFTISFGALVFARILELKLFGSVQLLTPYSILTCTAMYLVNNLLLANAAADAPAQIGIYMNARPAADLSKIPESEFKAAIGES